MPFKVHLFPVEQVADRRLEYVPTELRGPRLDGFRLRLFRWLAESRLFGSLLLSHIKDTNKFQQTLSHTAIPDAPMFVPEFPSEVLEVAPENGTVRCQATCEPSIRVASALLCLPLGSENEYPFSYWKIRDYADAYRTKSITPSEVAERFIKACEKSQTRHLPMSFFINTNAYDIRQQAAASSERFAAGKPLSILDGILIAVKDDIDCLPYPTTGGSKWLQKVRAVTEDAACVARLRKCGMIFVGKTNMNELGVGVNGNNPHYGVVRNPYNVQCYSGGSAAGSIGVVSSGLCPVALGTDGGGSMRIPASLCGVVGLKTTFGRTTLAGVLSLGWTLEVVCPAATTVEDILLVYAGMLGCHPQDVFVYPRVPPTFPMLEGARDFKDFPSVIGKLRIGKYSAWFNHVKSNDIIEACDYALKLLVGTYGNEIKQIVVPELDELRIGHLATFGSELATALNADYENGYKTELCCEVRGNLALFRTFTSRDYLAAQRLRRRVMYHHMEAFRTVDVIVTPTTGMTAPIIPANALSEGESDLEVTGCLMRFLPGPNFIGLPAISVPVGYDAEGLPIGLQLIGRPWSEATLLRLASALEKLFLPARKKPTVYFDILKKQGPQRGASGP